MLERECFGKNVLSNLSSRKMCSNIEKCVFRRVSQWNTLFYMEKFMKKFLLSLSLIAVMLCGLCACSNNGTFFSKEILQYKSTLLTNIIHKFLRIIFFVLIF